jgi:hypothetical protein
LSETQLDPVFRDFFLKQGGEAVLGPVISSVQYFEHQKIQITEKAVLLFDPNSSVEGSVNYWTVGDLMGIQEHPIQINEIVPPDSLIVNGHVIPTEFSQLYMQLGGESLLGRPLTEVRFNPTYNRYEQFYERIGLYFNVNDSSKKVQLLNYGKWMCKNQCLNGKDKNGNIDLIPIDDPEIRNYVYKLGMEYTGYLIDKFIVGNNDSQKTEWIFKNMVVIQETMNPVNIKIISVPDLIGIPTELPALPSQNADMVFVPTQGDNRGFDVPFQIHEYITMHGGYQNSGLPISKLQQNGTKSRQCFENLCLIFDSSQPKWNQIEPESLGYYYQRLRRGSFNPYDENYTTSKEKETDRDFLKSELSVLIWEEKPTITTKEPQAIFLQIEDKNNLPMAGVKANLILKIPDKKEMVFVFQPTDQNGLSNVFLPVIVMPNTTIIPYQVCIDKKYNIDCMDDYFIIWNSP